MLFLPHSRPSGRRRLSLPSRSFVTACHDGCRRRVPVPLPLLLSAHYSSHPWAVAFLHLLSLPVINSATRSCSCHHRRHAAPSSQHSSRLPATHSVPLLVARRLHSFSRPAPVAHHIPALQYVPAPVARRIPAPVVAMTVVLQHDLASSPYSQRPSRVVPVPDDISSLSADFGSSIRIRALLKQHERLDMKLQAG